MKSFYTLLTHILIAVGISVSFVSCEDDFPNQIIAGEGESVLTATVQFQPLISSLDKSRAAAGNIMRDINSLAIAIYTPDGQNPPKLYKLYNLTSGQYSKIKDTGDTPGDYGGTAAESNTARYQLTVPEPLPFGKYYIYAVANLGTTLTEAQASTPAGLQEMVMNWNEADVTKNAQMFGYFNEGLPGSGNAGPTNGVYEAPLITVNKTQTNIHAWMRRLASKVTICFNGSKLNESVFVYIHKATVKQIPKQCYLGKNTPVGGTAAKDTVNYITGQSVYYNAQGRAENEDKYPNTAQYKNWLMVMKASPLQGAVSGSGDDMKEHSETDLALFFYENMQGDFSGLPETERKKYDKKQSKDAIGTNIVKPGQEDYKDNVPCGTYIEVEGFYVNTYPSSQSSGKITYRFMLGQDIDYSYNCERNQHYKLTMNFLGNANQVDWHINYVEDNPGNFPPEEYRVPYLYNQQLEFPIRITGNPKRVWVQVVENNWAPFDSTRTDSVPPQEVGTGKLRFQWNRPVYMNNGKTLTTFNPDNYKAHGSTTATSLTNQEEINNYGYWYGKRRGDMFGIYTEANIRKYLGLANNENIPAQLLDKAVYTDVNREVSPIWAGFLALKAPSGYTETGTALPVGIFNTASKDFYSNTGTYKGMQLYYLGQGGGNDNNSISQNIAMFDLTDAGKSPNSTGRNAYRVKINRDVNGKEESKTLYIPLFTRPKALGYISGFSGNNCYEDYPRKATLRITIEYEKMADGRTPVIVKESRIIQERRIVNPKAIWRRWDNPGTFQVTLSQTVSPASSTFQGVRSFGKWTAKVEGGDGAFSVSPTEGSTGSVISFNVKFNGSLSSADETKCGRVVVKYHGGTCEHLIFLRQGYNKPIALVNNGAQWSSYSVYRFTDDAGTVAELTKTPTSVSSFFKLLCKSSLCTQGIKASNNTKYGPLEPINGKTLELTNGNSSLWKDIGGNTYWTKSTDPKKNQFTWNDFSATVNGASRNYRLPTYDDFNALVTQGCDFGYGILYADGATSTALDTQTAYGQTGLAYDSENSTCGMRGVIVYNPNLNFNQIFFPVGSYGIGRRTQKTDAGYLRYGALPYVLECTTRDYYNQYRPICYNLPASPGALYWIKSSYANNYVGWDMNYFDMSFNGQDYGATNGTGAAAGSSDAFLMKPVLK